MLAKAIKSYYELLKTLQLDIAMIRIVLSATCMLMFLTVSVATRNEEMLSIFFKLILGLFSFEIFNSIMTHLAEKNDAISKDQEREKSYFEKYPQEMAMFKEYAKAMSEFYPPSSFPHKFLKDLPNKYAICLVRNSLTIMGKNYQSPKSPSHYTELEMYKSFDKGRFENQEYSRIALDFYYSIYHELYEDHNEGHQLRWIFNGPDFDETRTYEYKEEKEELKIRKEREDSIEGVWFV